MTQGHHVYLIAVIAGNHTDAGQPAFCGLGLSQDGEFMAKRQIKFVKEGNMQDGPFMIGDIEVTDELLEKVEAYVQEEIEMMHKPTVLH